MTPLSYHQKQLILDFCIGIASEEESQQAKQLIESSDEASKLYGCFKNAVSPFEAAHEDNCPDHLVESTVLRLKDAARTTQLHLEQLIENERRQKTRFRLPQFGELLATAAAIILIAGAIIPPLHVARLDSWRKQCQAQLANVFTGVSQYANDHNGSMPAISASAGQPWWKVGDNGSEDVSNTRPMWMLVRQQYVQASDFVCPGKRQGSVLQLDPARAGDYNDFPKRKYVTYSIRVMCDKTPKKLCGSTRPLLSDVNPIFENLPDHVSRELRIELDEKLLNANSTNHKGRGQNVLFCDGSAKFTKTRRIGAAQDDIYTVENTRVYRGNEVPSCESDSFLAP